MNNKPCFQLNSEEKVVLSSALELFLSNEIEDISFKAKQEHNLIAISILNKLSNLKEPFNAEDFRIMAISLFYFQDTIDESTSSLSNLNLDKDTEKYSLIISDILDMIESILNSIGSSLYS